MDPHTDKLKRDWLTAGTDLAALRDTLHDLLLPQLALELALDHADTAWLSEWLSDTSSIFRLFRRHKFIRSFTLQEIRAISVWRLRVLRPILHLPLPSLFHCLPPPVTDPFGRPIIVLKLASLQSFSCPFKHVLLQEVERLRLHLRYIHDHANAGALPLQYLVLVDLDDVSVQNYNLDLCSWILSDIIPRYPGMLAAVFLLNYSWTHSGAWSVAKRILPSSIIGRVSFLSKAQLVSYCSAANLPAEYGGSLPTLDQIDDALRGPYQTHHLRPGLSDGPLPLPQIDAPRSSSSASLQRVPSTIALAPLSSSNPFFGYPATASTASPHMIRAVQRGWPALARTLAVLWWRRWACWVWTWTGVCVVAFAVALRMRRGVARTKTWARMMVLMRR